MSATTKLRLKNMVFYGHHGVYAAERDLGQKIEVDVELSSDFRPAGKADDLDLTINYSKVYQLVKRVVETEQYNLIEAIAAAILAKIRGAYSVHQVTVRVRKPQPPVGGVLDTVEFEISEGP
ncbi:MAG: dihydroneopterin aldolase [Bacillota bacterium]|jgi:dihydroneopterin aldolase